MHPSSLYAPTMFARLIGATAANAKAKSDARAISLCTGMGKSFVAENLAESDRDHVIYTKVVENSVYRTISQIIYNAQKPEEQFNLFGVKTPIKIPYLKGQEAINHLKHIIAYRASAAYQKSGDRNLLLIIDNVENLRGSNCEKLVNILFDETRGQGVGILILGNEDLVLPSAPGVIDPRHKRRRAGRGATLSISAPNARISSYESQPDNLTPDFFAQEGLVLGAWLGAGVDTARKKLQKIFSAQSYASYGLMVRAMS